MNRRELLKAGALQAGLGLLGLDAGTAKASAEEPAARPNNTHPLNMNIRDYLSREARKITDRAGAACKDATALRESVAERRRQYLDMMGLQQLPPYEERPPLNVNVTGVVERPRYRVEKLYYESLPKLYVTANLYVPNNLTSRAPGVLFVCGHGTLQNFHNQAHPRRWAELGFVTLIVETIEGGEARGEHHGCCSRGWFHWYSRGYTPAGIELLNGISGARPAGTTARSRR